MIGPKEKLVWCPFITYKTAQWDNENTEATYFTPCTKEDCIYYNRYEHDDIITESLLLRILSYCRRWDKENLKSCSDCASCSVLDINCYEQCKRKR